MSTIANNIPFVCKHKNKTWNGSVTLLINRGSHYEINLESRSDIRFMIGKYTNGGFVSIPAYNAGSDLADYSDYFWNYERLCQTVNTVDAVTIAECIRTLYKGKHIQ